MKAYIVVLLFGVLVSGGFCDLAEEESARTHSEKSENNTYENSPITALRLSVLRSLKDVAVCFGTFDGSCFLDKAEDALVATNRAFLGEL